MAVDSGDLGQKDAQNQCAAGDLETHCLLDGFGHEKLAAERRPPVVPIGQHDRGSVITYFEELLRCTVAMADGDVDVVPASVVHVGFRDDEPNLGRVPAAQADV